MNQQQSKSQISFINKTLAPMRIEPIKASLMSYLTVEDNAFIAQIIKNYLKRFETGIVQIKKSNPGN